MTNILKNEKLFESFIYALLKLHCVHACGQVSPLVKWDHTPRSYNHKVNGIDLSISSLPLYTFCQETKEQRTPNRPYPLVQSI